MKKEIIMNRPDEPFKVLKKTKQCKTHIVHLYRLNASEPIYMVTDFVFSDGHEWFKFISKDHERRFNKNCQDFYNYHEQLMGNAKLQIDENTITDFEYHSPLYIKPRDFSKLGITEEDLPRGWFRRLFRMKPRKAYRINSIAFTVTEDLKFYPEATLIKRDLHYK